MFNRKLKKENANLKLALETTLKTLEDVKPLIDNFNGAETELYYLEVYIQTVLDGDIPE